MQTNQIMNLIGTRCLCLLRPQQVFCQQNMKFCERYIRAKENVSFLKMQREHLKELRRKIIKERTLIKEKLNELDEQIKTIQKKNYDRKNKSPDSYS